MRKNVQGLGICGTIRKVLVFLSSESWKKREKESRAEKSTLIWQEIQTYRLEKLIKTQMNKHPKICNKTNNN